MRSQTLTTLQESIEAALLLAQTSCQTAQWTAVIDNCESAITQCKQALELEQPATTPSAKPSTSELIPNAAQSDSEQTVAQLHLAKGDLLEKQGDLAEAIAFYQRAIALAPTSAEIQDALSSAYLARAMQLQRSGDTVAATQQYLQAITQFPHLFTAYSRLRYNLLRYDIPRADPLLQDVVQTCQAILAKHPQLRPARITLSYALTRLNRTNEAIVSYRSITGSSQSASRHAPDVIIIGAEKSGTTSLHQYLRSHPQFIPPAEKEIDFFDLEYCCGLDWYLAHFPPASAQTPPPQTNLPWISGETSANYLYSDVAPTRIFEHFPKIKLAVILRDPVDRTVSRYNMMVRNGAEKRSFSVAIAEEIDAIQKATKGDEIDWKTLNRCRHVGNSLYYCHLKRWLSLFPQEQFVILQSEDLFKQPQQTMERFYALLNIATDSSQQQYPQHNAGNYQPANTEVRQHLAQFFAPHNRKLEALLDRSFSWTSFKAFTQTAL